MNLDKEFDEKFTSEYFSWEQLAMLKSFIHQKHREYIEKKIVEVDEVSVWTANNTLKDPQAIKDEIIANYKKELTEIV